jgi:hypothetical protein
MSEQSLILIREYFTYDPESGIVSYRKAPKYHEKYVGKEAGKIKPNTYKGVQTNQYRSLVFFNKDYLVHHIAWFLHHGSWPTEQIDHIDGNGINNKIKNLREATSAQNCQNRRQQPNESTGITGVTKRRDCDRYQATIEAKRKYYHLGIFPTLEEAIEARRAAELKYHGAYSVNHKMEKNNA